MSFFKSLKRNQKEAIGLLQVGTFLEYFDLMLYVHMAVLLNELFFPKTDPHTTALISAFAFCSTYVLRPFGALLFGWIGDNIGRKPTVVITTTMMSISCVLMANLPTYAQIGTTAAIIVTGCRIVQGLSSMGEIMGAQLYVTEITKPPQQYMAVSLVSFSSAFGSMAALAVACLVTKYEANWRIAFWVGAGIAVVGSIARTRLRETAEFVAAKNNIRKKRAPLTASAYEQKKTEAELPLKLKTLLAYSLVFCGWPLTFYLSYIYFNPMLKDTFCYSAEDVISHNFFLAVSLCCSSLFFSFLSQKISPLSITKTKGFIGLITILLLPLLLSSIQTSFQLFMIQFILLNFTFGEIPSGAIFIKHFPVLKRFTATSALYALTRAVMYIITSFGLVYLNDIFGHYGLWFIALPVTAGFLYGVNYFGKLENQYGKKLLQNQNSQETSLVHV